jgi:predicted O-methyltransferase YrrM
MEASEPIPFNTRDGRAGLVQVESTSSRTGWEVHRTTFDADQFDRDRRSSPWSGHRWFAYDLIRWMKPSSIVELGTHFGCSFFSFCQAVRDGSIPTSLVAVDTWQGDEHAGRYSDEVYELFLANLKHFQDLDVTVKRMTFDEALAEQPEGSVDLLHIDGFHSYEALEHDLTTWLPTLSENAVVLLHDIDPASGYGSADYWRELTERYGSIQFLHNFGLGVLPIGERAARLLLSPDFRQLMPIYEVEAARDLAAMQVEDLGTMLRGRDETIAAQDALIADRDGTIAAQDALIADRDGTIASMTKYVDEQRTVIESQDLLIKDRDEAIAAQARYIDEQAALIRAQDALVAERDELLRQQAEELAQLQVGR